MYVDQNLYHGRPVSGQRLDKELRCYDLLDRLGLAYDRADHDAADDTPCVDLGGRRMIKKKKNRL